jgi:hypothetical protein
MAAPGATFLLYGFAGPPRLAPILARVNLDEVRQRFSPDWEIISAQPTSPAALQLARRRADGYFVLWRFQLRRLAGECSVAASTEDVAVRASNLSA